MKRNAQLITALLFTLFLACSKDEPVPVEIAQVNASVTSNRITEGSTATLTFTISQAIEEPVTINFNIEGSATAQLDYTGLNSSLTSVRAMIREAIYE